MELPPKIQNQIAQLQQLQQQTQMAMNQKYQMEVRLSEVKAAVDELQKPSENRVIYKGIGDLMVKVENVDELSKELSEEKETIPIRIKTLENQEKQMKEKLKALQEQITNSMKLTADGSQNQKYN
ncbi:MAG: prefoldin subunit beta [Thermoplasmata archaeon]